MTRAFINGKEVSREELRDYEIILDATSGRVISFRKKESEKIDGEKEEISTKVLGP